MATSARAEPDDGDVGPTPVGRLRGVHSDMVEAVLSGDGLPAVASLAARACGAPVAIVVPRIGEVAIAPPSARADAAALRRYVTELSRDRPSPVPSGLSAEVPIATGGERVGAVL